MMEFIGRASGGQILGYQILGISHSVFLILGLGRGRECGGRKGDLGLVFFGFAFPHAVVINSANAELGGVECMVGDNPPGNRRGRGSRIFSSKAHGARGERASVGSGCWGAHIYPYLR